MLAMAAVSLQVEKPMARGSVKQAEHSMHFEAMITPHMQGLSALAWRLTGDATQAQDLVQETLLKAYRYLYRFEPGTNFWAWLATMMRNLFFSQLRKQAREIVMDNLEGVAAADTTEDAPLGAHLTELTAALPHLVSDDVFLALQELPATHQAAVLLADVLDYSYKDMATIMGCPIGTVMSRLYRGRQKLQARLQPYAVAQGYIHPERQTHVAAHFTEDSEDAAAEVVPAL
jgi:RNA polymerase sigma-70 factor, ECF subfamily